MIVYLASGGFRLDNLPEVPTKKHGVHRPELPHEGMHVLLTFYHEKDPNYETLINDKRRLGKRCPSPDRLLPRHQDGRTP